MTGGSLVVVGTPIGNMGDLSPRAAEALASADLVACEDTRRARKLFDLAGLPVPKLVVVNDHTEARQLERVVDAVLGGQRVVLISDAGMPGISDPGADLVRAAIEADLEIGVVPGPTAAVTALALSGLPAGRFCFEGFLPRKGAARTERLQVIASEPRTTVLYESPNRLAKTLGDLADHCGPGRSVVIGRELTKKFEEFWRGTVEDAARWAAVGVKGEVVVVVGGAEPMAPPDDAEIDAALRAELGGGASTRDAVASVVAALGVGKRAVYDRALAVLREGE